MSTNRTHGPAAKVQLQIYLIRLYNETFAQWNLSCTVCMLIPVNIIAILFSYSSNDHERSEECPSDNMLCREPFLDDLNEIEGYNDIRN